MNLVFTGALYLVAGIVAIAWLVSQRRISESPVVRIVGILFWPAYVPACLAQDKTHAALDGDAALSSLGRQIDRLVKEPHRRRGYQASVDRLRHAMVGRQREIDRLRSAATRLQQMRRGLGASETALVDVRLSEIGEAKARVEEDVRRAREAVLRLVLRVEVIGLEDSKGRLDCELVGLEDELGRLLDARRETEALLE